MQLIFVKLAFGLQLATNLTVLDLFALIHQQALAFHYLFNVLLDLIAIQLMECMLWSANAELMLKEMLIAHCSLEILCIKTIFKPLKLTSPLVI